LLADDIRGGPLVLVQLGITGFTFVVPDEEERGACGRKETGELDEAAA
jgi:hypothetical protein